MANITPTGSKLQSLYGQAVKSSWMTMLQGDDGLPIGNAQFTDRSVQAVGTWGGATLTVEGSNDGGTTWATLQDAEGAALSISSNDFKQIMEVSELIRPNLTGGDGTTDIDVHIVMVAR